MRKAFMPLNRRMVEIVVGNADLLEDEMSAAFLHLVAHVASYETILGRWDAQEYEEHVPRIAFPKEIHDLVKAKYDYLRVLQQRLLASRTDRKSVV
jgi:hypothetical protein